MSEHRHHRLPEPTGRELRAWRRMVRVALAVADGPGSPGELAHAAKAAHRSVAPSVDGKPVDQDNPFVRLVRGAQRFVAADDPERDEMAGELKALAEACPALTPAGSAPGASADPKPPEPRRHPGYADD